MKLTPKCCEKSKPLDQIQLLSLTKKTIEYYDREARNFWQGTQDHDVSQNYKAFLEAIKSDLPNTILDLGCGPGRDLLYFKSKGHNATGLDGAREFVTMARLISNCQVLHQDFLTMKLPQSHFDGVFANASLFHVPSQELPQVLTKIFSTLKPNGIFFCSNPRGSNEEGYRDERYCCFFEPQTWCDFVKTAGFTHVQQYFRPPGVPRHQQPWLATVWRKI